MATNAEKIAEIDEKLDSGVTDVAVDGLRTHVDHDSLRKRRDELIAATPALAARRRRRLTTLDLGNAW